MTLNRAYLKILIFFLIGTPFVAAQESTRQVVLGSEDAPVEVIEYMSLTCSHCAQFHTETLPSIMKRYVDTGKVRLIVRDFPLDGVAYQAAIISHCVGDKNPQRYYGFVQYLFQQQQRWAAASNPIVELARMSKVAGLNLNSFEICLKNKSLGNQILRTRQLAESEYKVNSTPTLIINGRTYPGAMSLDEFHRTIEPLITK